VNFSWGSNPIGRYGGEFRLPLNYQTGGFNCTVCPNVEYFILRMLENNPGWRTRWFYAKVQPVTGQNVGLE
jgi:hypothetical protein